ncbi:Nicotinate-nucleotide adenylyltransferase [Candidatus Arsenophonus lipoptenae]|uniref:Probable nicotinate-nucleotide adenylyltransferase n=1 Tax=Candidatus Arsenophonus lipoptenae TaxID=634113 RepID=A0A109QBB5_9GAMM|nr:nicotinate-nucleotide adenylyltransferase [Candidatus Arsenophonus lipoptenae]AMA65141.1 Nicotinate-nucleotide adenylyltransferase [Candidatus Arsenophonus lipoptenae]
MNLQAKQKSNFPVIKALFGGTFDPIHYGHLLPIEKLAQQVYLQKVILIPNHIPPHKSQPTTTAQQRLDMLKLAIKHKPLFSIDTREFNRITPSYTIETILSIRQQIGWKKSLAFIIGQDSLLSINTWFNWQKILKICHLLVYPRPGYTNKCFENIYMRQWIKQYQVYFPAILRYKPFGAIYLANTPLLNISSTEIRKYQYDKKNSKKILPPLVLRYVKKNQLYKNEY